MALHLQQVALGSWQDRVRDVSLDLLHLCGGLQVFGERREALAAAEEPGGFMDFGGQEVRTGEVNRGQPRRVGLW